MHNQNRKQNTFKIKTGHYLKLLTPEMMNLLGSAKSKITKDENGEDIPYLEITKVVLIKCNVVNNSYQQIEWSTNIQIIFNILTQDFVNHHREKIKRR